MWPFTGDPSILVPYGDIGNRYSQDLLILRKYNEKEKGGEQKDGRFYGAKGAAVVNFTLVIDIGGGKWGGGFREGDGGGDGSRAADAGGG